MVLTLYLVAGNSICTYVHGFEPYFYIEAPRGFGPDDCDSLCAQLNVSSWPCSNHLVAVHATDCRIICTRAVIDNPKSLCMQRMLGDRNSKGGRQTKFCLRVDMVQKQTIMHYQPHKSRTFLCIVVATPNLVTQARGGHACPV